jgi:uncharacterized coiled-coil protein SlyX
MKKFERGGLSMAIEAGNHTAWVHDALVKWGAAVTMVNPTMVKLIAESRRKTDKIDAKILCERLRLDALPHPVHMPSPQARDYVRRINFVYTPKHGSWRNVAECELSCLTSPCLQDRRIGELETRQSEIAAWSTRVNQKQHAVDWQFTIDKARVKLKRLYPKI